MIGREMTKLFEEFVLFTAGQWDIKREVITQQGEFTVGVAGSTQVEQALDYTEVSAALKRLRQAGFSAKDSAKALAAVNGMKVNEIKQISFAGSEAVDD